MLSAVVESELSSTFLHSSSLTQDFCDLPYVYCHKTRSGGLQPELKWSTLLLAGHCTQGKGCLVVSLTLAAYHNSGIGNVLSNWHVECKQRQG